MAASTWSTTDKNANLTLSGSNLIATAAAGLVSGRGKDPKRTGKYYIEYTSTTTQNASNQIGFASVRAALGASNQPSSATVLASSGAFVGYDTFGVGAFNIPSGVSFTTGTVVCFAIDLDNGLIWVRSGAAGNWNGNAANNPATGIGGGNLPAVGLGQGIDCYPFLYLGAAANSITANFGGSAFTGTVPSGFTSGWDDSVSIVTNAVATSLAAEHWLTTSPNAQFTQVALEHWATVGSTGVQAVVTQIALEQWAAVVPPARGGPMVTMVM